MSNKFYYLIATVVLLVGASYFLFKDFSPAPSKSSPRIVSADVYNGKQAIGEFQGEKGEKLTMVDDKLLIPVSGFATNQVRYFNVDIDGKTVYFMVVKDSQGVYRAAANGCEVCFGARKGFRQVGDKIICNNCGNAFDLNTLGVTKGGCNPGPISANIPTPDNQLILRADELRQVTNLF